MNGEVMLLESTIAKLGVELASANARIVALERELKMANLKAASSLANNLCPDHRDKQTGKRCLACTIDQLQARIAQLEQQLPPLTDAMYHAARGLELTFSGGGTEAVIGFINDDVLDEIWDAINTALRVSLPKTSADDWLAAHDNEVIERCADHVQHVTEDNDLANLIRALKGKP